MNWFSNMFRKASKTGAMVSAHLLGRAVFPARNFTTYAKEAYQLNIIAYRCIELISTSGASVPFILYDETKDEEIKDKKHPILQLLRRPNPLQSGKEFFTSAYAYDLLTGNSYLERVPLDAGDIKELWSLRPDRMKVVPGPFGMPSRFEYTIGGKEPVKFEVDPIDNQSDILHVKRFNPLDDWYGQSPLQAIGMSVDSHNEATRWNFSLLQNAARPSGALQYEGELDETEFTRLKKELEEGYSKGRQGRPMLLEGGLTWVQMMLSQVDMDWLAGKERAASEIAIGYKVPEQLVGVKGQQTYNNYREARMALYEDAVLPLLDRYCECLTYWFKSVKGLENFCLKYDEDRIPALYPRREVMWEKVNAAKFITIDEKREALGYEAYDPADTSPGNLIFISATELPLSDPGLGNNMNADPSAVDPNNPDALGAGTLGGVGTRDHPVQDLALNGAQIAAVVEIVQAVADKVLPPDSAVQLLLVAFPSIDEATAHLMIDPADEFEPPPPDPVAMMPGVPPIGGKPAVPPMKPKTPAQKKVMHVLLQQKYKLVQARHTQAFKLAYGGTEKKETINVSVKSGDTHVTTPDINVDARTTTDNNVNTEVKETKKELPAKVETKYIRDPVSLEITGKVDTITYKEPE